MPQVSGATEAAIQPNTYHLHRISDQPFMRCVDYAKVVEIAKRHNLITVVDATFATPVNCRPLAHGVDLVIHSLTKYLAGTMT
ncbi:MAG: PLP-dependent transferase [Caldilineaceae bacterium]